MSTPLPNDLLPFEALIQSAMRKAVVLRETKAEKGYEPDMGYTRANGEPDLPSDVEWTRCYGDSFSSPYDEPSFWLQVNLEEIPGQARNNPAVPSAGCLWVYVDLSENGDERNCKGIVHFDPRPAKEIPWRPRKADMTLTRTSFDEIDMAPDTLDVFEHMGDDQLQDLYWEHFFQKDILPLRHKPYFGGYAWTIQGEAGGDNDIFCTMTDQGFLDGGCIYVYFSAERGWWVDIQTH